MQEYYRYYRVERPNGFIGRIYRLDLRTGYTVACVNMTNFRWSDATMLMSRLLYTQQVTFPDARLLPYVMLLEGE